MKNTLAEVISCTGTWNLLADQEGVELGQMVGDAVPDGRGFSIQNLLLLVF
jgi:hypothetical protein